MYFLRTDAVPFEENLVSLFMKYQEENLCRIRNTAEEYLLVIGGYDTREEAEQRCKEMMKKYGADNGFYVSSGTIGDVPE